MPNRIIREGILTSEKVNALKPRAELFYRRLMSVVDDYGRFSAHPAILRASCYPLCIDSVREADISRHLTEAQAAGLIALYEVEGKWSLEMRDFRQRLRTKNSKHPPPENGRHMAVTCQTDDGHMTVTCPHETEAEAEAQTEVEAQKKSAAHSLEQKSPQAAIEREKKATAFDEFWQSYPKKRGKQNARKAWKRLKLNNHLQRILAAIEVQKQCRQWQDEGGKYIPYPATWLNAGSWEDEIEVDEIKLNRPRITAEQMKEKYAI